MLRKMAEATYESKVSVTQVSFTKPNNGRKLYWLNYNNWEKEYAYMKIVRDSIFSLKFVYILFSQLWESDI